MIVDGNALELNQYSNTRYCHHQNELCMRCLLQRDSCFPKNTRRHLEPLPQSLHMASQMHDAPVHANADKRVMQQPGSSLKLLSGLAAQSSGTAEKSARGLQDNKHGAGACEY